MLLTDHDHVVGALAPKGPDPAFTVSVRLGRVASGDDPPPLRWTPDLGDEAVEARPALRRPRRMELRVDEDRDAVGQVEACSSAGGVAEPGLEVARQEARVMVTKGFARESHLC